MAGQLTLSEREQVAQFSNQGLSRTEISRRLGRHRTTIGRELARNSTAGVYWASTAQEKAKARRQRRPRKLDNVELSMFVRSGLEKRWSPEQIAGRWRREFPKQPRCRVSYMTIYRWIANSPYRYHFESLLRFGRRSKEPENGGKMPARADIAGRPAIVDQRGRFGDWEGDTIVGKRRRGGLVTLVERKSGFALVRKVDCLEADHISRVIARQFASLPCGLRHTATFDNGGEFQRPQRITASTGVKIYFARPYRSWERGSNESFNGLVRQFFPKRTDFRDISPREVKRVLDLLNNRPRKRLGYRTPRELLAQHFNRAFQV
jgi:transposase, IS30 family